LWLKILYYKQFELTLFKYYLYTLKFIKDSNFNYFILLLLLIFKQFLVFQIFLIQGNDILSLSLHFLFIVLQHLLHWIIDILQLLKWIYVKIFCFFNFITMKFSWTHIIELFCLIWIIKLHRFYGQEILIQKDHEFLHVLYNLL